MSEKLILPTGALMLIGPVLLVVVWANSADTRLAEAEAATDAAAVQVAVAKEANEAYCTPALKQILRRVLLSCGLIGGRAGRGCQPVDAKAVATMSGDDFNALFLPMQHRGGIIQFDQGSGELDAADQALVNRIFAERRGASYFLVVSRASPEGSVATNRALSKQRAERVLTHLQQMFNDPDLERQVGLLWLGEEFAQLSESFCDWQRSGQSEACRPEDLNRSAFITWIDCRL